MNLRTNKKMTRLLSVLIPLAGVQACAQNGKVDLGASVTGANLADYVDAWDGYTEAQQFVFDSDRIRVRINGNGLGTLVLGESQAYPPATDPNVGYPPNEDSMSAIIKTSMFRAGMEYPLHGVKVESKRIRFTVSTNDFYKSWCELQTPVATNDPNVFSCGPNRLHGHTRWNVLQRGDRRADRLRQGSALRGASRMHLHGDRMHRERGLLHPVRRCPARRRNPAGGNIQQRHRPPRAAIARRLRRFKMMGQVQTLDGGGTAVCGRRSWRGPVAPASPDPGPGAGEAGSDDVRMDRSLVSGARRPAGPGAFGSRDQRSTRR